jgi:hypothetical protein
MSHRNRANAHTRANVPIELTAYASALRPLVAQIRKLADDATAAPGERVHTRGYLRGKVLRALRELEVHLDAAAPREPAGDAPSDHGDPAGCGGAGPCL